MIEITIKVIFLRIKNGKWLIGTQLNIRAIEYLSILVDLSEEIAIKFVEKRTEKRIATMPMVELKMPKTVIYLDCQTKEDLKIIEESILNKCTSPMNTKNVRKNTTKWFYVEENETWIKNCEARASLRFKTCPNYNTITNYFD